MNSPTQSSPWTGIDLADASAVVGHALALYGARVVIAASFSAEDVLLIDLALTQDSSARIFALDTGRLPEATYACADAVAQRYGIQIEWYSPDTQALETLTRTQGVLGFRESLSARRRCCAVRKIEPLQRVLSTADAWITGQRRAQSVTRQSLEVLEYASDGPLKINPLAAWSLAEVQAETTRRGLPQNSLYAEGYPSIGCAPCTRAVAPDEDERAGRWWWEHADHKECGLHGRPGFEHLTIEEPS